MHAALRPAQDRPRGRVSRPEPSRGAAGCPAARPAYRGVWLRGDAWPTEAYGSAAVRRRRINPRLRNEFSWRAPKPERAGVAVARPAAARQRRPSHEGARPAMVMFQPVSWRNRRTGNVICATQCRPLPARPGSRTSRSCSSRDRRAPSRTKPQSRGLSHMSGFERQSWGSSVQDSAPAPENYTALPGTARAYGMPVRRRRRRRSANGSKGVRR